MKAISHSATFRNKIEPGMIFLVAHFAFLNKFEKFVWNSAH